MDRGEPLVLSDGQMRHVLGLADAATSESVAWLPAGGDRSLETPANPIGGNRDVLVQRVDDHVDAAGHMVLPH